MLAADLINDLMHAGFSITLSGTQLVVSPASRLTDDQCSAIRSHKACLVQFLLDEQATTTSLIAAVMKVCDQYGDNDARREEMRQDCLTTPQHLRADLLDHFQQTHPKAK